LSLIPSYVPTPAISAAPAMQMYHSDNELGRFICLHLVCVQVKLWTLLSSDLINES